MSNVITAEFHVAKRFEVDNQIGYLIYKCDDDKMPYYLAFESVIGERQVDHRFEIEVPIRNGRVLPPTNMIPVWTSEQARQRPDAVEDLEKIYLSHLYLIPLQTKRNKQQSFDKEVVFATPELRIVEQLYWILTNTKLRDVLAKDNFYYMRNSVRTRFDGDGPTISYKTPRMLRYFPEDQIVSVVFFIGDTPKIIEPKSGTNYREKIPSTNLRTMVTRTTTGEGWISLRDYMKMDPKIDKFVRDFCAAGHATPEAQ